MPPKKRQQTRGACVKAKKTSARSPAVRKKDNKTEKKGKKKANSATARLHRAESRS